ncbi:MAG: M48 family metallopeptidase [Candidatus Gracilibacteria bacterium]|nr:M48 family metallopeptidase [Candidatus Gracilibacteria bacterium]
MLNSLLTVEIFFYTIIALVIFEFLLSKTLSYLNTKNWSDKLPKELEGIYDQEKYAKSMKYEKAKHKFSNISSILSFNVMIFLLIFGAFGALYNYLTIFTSNVILLTLYFFGIIAFVQTIVGLPFSYYSTFVIEEKFGFNKMTKKLFFIDAIKGLVLSFIIGGLLLALVTWIYTITGTYFWIYAWVLITAFSVFMMMFYSSLIVPLFNKQTPLEDGKLRDEIEAFASSVGFKLDNIFVIDGSKRSSKANAYFSGFGPKKRIVLYDTLIKDLSKNELVAVLAHEIGHYKKKHTLQMLAFSIFQTGIMFYILGITLTYNEVSFALGSKMPSFALGLLAFGILFTPISIIFGLIGNIFSRKNEYEADHFAGTNYKANKLKSALIKLSINNLSNLRPHPAYEFFYYSHPTVLKRLNALDKIKKK